ncbi:hypothetical protein Mterra_00068 [Calidithermus terrae]|uniref:Uncharacterized protein n=1 Tax=Calidithermus terrae TaxID=1408545 RepID=A0A399F502_9DEIN|nr:DUF1905 domain-containing protein [Calidithermus terrae]RIH90845.1 hypothetical protein Mterra_00068 [Calidithermus terrae]
MARPRAVLLLAVPEEQSRAIKSAGKLLTYGWGVIPVRACVGRTEWKTSLFPKDGLYLVPLKDEVRKAEGLGKGDAVRVRLELGP